MLAVSVSFSVRSSMMGETVFVFFRHLCASLFSKFDCLRLGLPGTLVRPTQPLSLSIKAPADTRLRRRKQEAKNHPQVAFSLRPLLRPIAAPAQL
jgi:hypothetical protein